MVADMEAEKAKASLLELIKAKDKLESDIQGFKEILDCVGTNKRYKVSIALLYQRPCHSTLFDTTEVTVSSLDDDKSKAGPFHIL